MTQHQPRDHDPRNHDPGGTDPVDPPTDPGTGYGAVPPGWAPTAAGRGAGPASRRVPWWRQAPPWLLAAVAALLVVVLVLLARLLADGNDVSSATPAAPAPAAGPAAPALPDPTFEFTRGGYRYSIGVGPFTPAVSARGAATRSAPPGRHFLTAPLVIRNDAQDRGAPSPLNSNGAAPTIWVGLGGAPVLAPVHESFGSFIAASDCVNDPSRPTGNGNPPPAYRGIDPATCIVRASVVPARTVSILEDDTELPPGGIIEGVVTTIDLPDDVAVGPVTAWLNNDSGRSPAGNYAIFDRIS
ncbi:hypothetical protein [Actinomycetospora soli]|uniref:hypothetical protein n=1 Tax=Actinomycetospora soli TaxID=2893887 RepID=UPI001E5AA3AC|nr:hypothetical protein [Actinomycetospora soli]MCD2191317.1 hypothetical protein [Actinomycetospora soli]